MGSGANCLLAVQTSTEGKKKKTPNSTSILLAVCFFFHGVVSGLFTLVKFI